INFLFRGLLFDHRGEAADASLSGPGGNSEDAVWVEASSNAISMPGAPRSSSSGSFMRAIANAAKPR
ncbi:MAG: hypothetical protein WBZ22_22440, partial [Pseudolabrys sp.]